MHRRIVALAATLMLFAAACGGTDTGSQATGTPAGDAETTNPVETTAASDAAASPTTTGGTAATATTAAGTDDAATRAPSGVEGPAAPDFTLALGDGSTFVLSQEAKPVYLVFWAEW